ncbi:MAG: hypothetical protein HY284_01265 [Nitrospirae bacterium]|nr:hypothetical protein [Nitrospirota bacterium]
MDRPRAHNDLKAWLAVLLPALMFGAVGVSSVAAKELFKDEAGRLIYSIDDDGVVSMFESSPGIDITLSVTRGTRDEMQPRVTEVSPASVPAGTAPMLKIKGKNLVGATVKWSSSGIDMGPYATKPTILEIPLRVAPNVQPGEVAFQVTTPIGRTEASLKITEMQISSNTTLRRDGTARKAIPTTAPTSCPEGMVGVAAESGGFCIEIDRSLSGDIRKAEKACAMAGKRLCQANEWQHACEQARNESLPLKDIIGNWEWTGSYAKYDVGTAYFSNELLSILLGKSDCQTPYLYPSWREGPFPGRCCK